MVVDDELGVAARERRRLRDKRGRATRLRGLGRGLLAAVAKRSRRAALLLAALREVVGPTFGVLGDQVEDIGEILHAEEGTGIGRRALEAEPAARTHEDHTVAEVDALRGVRDHDDGATTAGERGEFLHEALLDTGVETARGLVQEEKARVGEHLDGDGCAFALPARERADVLVGERGELELLEDVVAAPLTLLRGGIGRHTQIGGVAQHVDEAQVVVDDILLRHIADTVLEDAVVAVEIHAVDAHRARDGRVGAVELVEERRLAGARTAQDRYELAALDMERDVVGRGALAAAHATDLDEVLGIDIDTRARAAAHERVARVDGRGVGDLDHVAALEHAAPLQKLTRDVGAVEAAEVADLPVVAHAHEGRVAGGDGGRTEDEVVAGGTTDGERHERAQVDGAPRGLLVAQQQHDAVVAARLDVADGGNIAGSEGHARRADPVDKDTVGGPVVLDIAGAALEQERPVELRDDAGGRGELDVVLRGCAKGHVLFVELAQVDLEQDVASLDHGEVERGHAVEIGAVVQKYRSGIARGPLLDHRLVSPVCPVVPPPARLCSRTGRKRLDMLFDLRRCVPAKTRTRQVDFLPSIGISPMRKILLRNIGKFLIWMDTPRGYGCIVMSR